MLMLKARIFTEEEGTHKRGNEDGKRKRCRDGLNLKISVGTHNVKIRLCECACMYM